MARIQNDAMLDAGLNWVKDNTEWDIELEDAAAP